MVLIMFYFVKKMQLSGKKMSPKNGFVFSTPAPKSHRFSVKESLEKADNEVSFSFSTPIPVKSPAKTKTCTNSLSQASKPASNFMPTLNTTQSEKSTSLFTTIPPTKDAPSAQNDVTLTTQDGEKSEPAKTDDRLKKFSPAVGSRESNSCTIYNEANIEKCVAYQTVNPEKTLKTNTAEQEKQVTDLKTKFEAPKNSFEFSTSVIRNSNDLDKSDACQNKRSGGSDDLKLKFAAPSDSWECPTCMIQNKAADMKCPACQTSKPGTEASSTASGFTMNSKSDSSSSSGFTFGIGNPCKPSGGFTFTASDSQNSAANGPTFTFGQTDKSKLSKSTFGNDATTANTEVMSTVTESATTSGFSFGTGNTNSTKAPPFTFGASLKSDESTSPFSFGVPSSTTSSGPFGDIKSAAGKTSAKPSSSRE